MRILRTESDLEALEDPDLLALIHQRIEEATEYVAFQSAPTDRWA